MTDVPPPSTPPPGPPPPPGAPPPPPYAEPPPPRQGLSTGVKIAIGCGAVLLLALILVFACFGIVAKKAGDRAEDFGAAMEDQEEASRKAEELEREHPFAPPADGELDEELVGKFFAVTDDAWDDIRDWAEEMEERGQAVEERGGDAGFGDVMAGVGGMGRARLAIVEALDAEDMAPGAYVWTGSRLLQAYDARESGPVAGIPEKNIELARKNAGRIAELQEDEEGGANKGAVLGLALMLFPRADAFVPPGVEVPGEPNP